MEEATVTPEQETVSVLEATNLHKRFDDLVAVDGISVSLAHGECFGLLGPNGAGKSTTMRMCLGLTPYDSGEITLMGHPLPEHLLEARQLVGVVPQDDILDPDFDIGENLYVYGSYFGISKSVLDERVPELLRFVELDERANEKIKNLSGGLRRRLTLARALVNQPRLLFLDEPTTGLDPQARHLYWERLRNLQDEGCTLFLTTHFMEEATRLCDRISIVDHGRIIASGTPTQLVDEHVENEVAEIHGDGSAKWVASRNHNCRVEQLGRVAYCYADDVSELANASVEEAHLTCTRRAANLEDVYLRLTGSSLRE